MSKTFLRTTEFRRAPPPTPVEDSVKEKRVADAPFHEPLATGDTVVLRSSDNVVFHASKTILSIASPTFLSLFTSPKEGSGKDDIVSMAEESETHRDIVVGSRAQNRCEFFGY